MAKASINLDANTEEADWTKQAWDLPPYLSKEFFDAMGPDFDLDHFKTLPVYLHAVDAGLIHDDEWVGDCCSVAEPAKPKPKGKTIHIHHHED